MSGAVSVPTVTRQTVSPRVRWAAVATVVMVAAVAAVMSYGHLRAVAAEQGEDAAALFPLSVDGLIVAASLVLLVRRRAGLAGGALAWCGLLVGVAATVAGNVASAEPTVLARLVAAWPPVAFALSYELLLTLIRPTTPAALPGEPPPGRGGLEERARELLAAGGSRPPGRRVLARQLGVSEHQARTVLAAVTARDTSPPNGTSRAGAADGEEPRR